MEWLTYVHVHLSLCIWSGYAIAYMHSCCVSHNLQYGGIDAVTSGPSKRSSLYTNSIRAVTELKVSTLSRLISTTCSLTPVPPVTVCILFPALKKTTSKSNPVGRAWGYVILAWRTWKDSRSRTTWKCCDWPTEEKYWNTESCNTGAFSSQRHAALHAIHIHWCWCCSPLHT